MKKCTSIYMNKCFMGCRKDIHDSIRYLYDNPTVHYYQLLMAAHKAEGEGNDLKAWVHTVTVKSSDSGRDRDQ